MYLFCNSFFFFSSIRWQTTFWSSCGSWFAFLYYCLYYHSYYCLDYHSYYCLYYHPYYCLDYHSYRWQTTFCSSCGSWFAFLSSPCCCPRTTVSRSTVFTLAEKKLKKTSTHFCISLITMLLSKDNSIKVHSFYANGKKVKKNKYTFLHFSHHCAAVQGQQYQGSQFLCQWKKSKRIKKTSTHSYADGKKLKKLKNKYAFSC